MHTKVTQGLKAQSEKVVGAITTLLSCLDRLIQFRVHLNPKQIRPNFKINIPSRQYLEEQRHLFTQSIENLCRLIKQFFLPLKPIIKDGIEEHIVSTDSLRNIKSHYHQKALGMQSSMREALGLARDSDGTARKRKHKPTPPRKARTALPPGVKRLVNLGNGRFRWEYTNGMSETTTYKLSPQYAAMAVRERKSPK